MEVGSLVICVDDSICIHALAPYESPVFGKIYTVRSIRFVKIGLAVTLEEIVNRNYVGRNYEIHFRIDRFREVLPPTKISVEAICESNN